MERVSVEERIRRAEERYYRTKESINAKDNIYKSPRSDEKNINNQNINLKDINNKIKRKIYKKKKGFSNSSKTAQFSYSSF